MMGRAAPFQGPDTLGSGELGGVDRRLGARFEGSCANALWTGCCVA